MNRSALLLLTDLNNGDADEDIQLAERLRKNFKVYLSHPSDTADLENDVSVVIVRNIWNPRQYGQPEPWRDRWRDKPWLPTHDDLHFSPGSAKDYLPRLWTEGWPTIPTVDSLDRLGELPAVDNYFIKPKDGFDALGARRVSAEQLRHVDLSGYLIQPFVPITHECSFYYLDGEFQYALETREPSNRWDLVEIRPSRADHAFAERFLRRNCQRRGIVRIDVCRQQSGDLLLMEISDQGGVYLSLSCLSAQTRERFLDDLTRSLERIARRERLPV